MLGVEKLRVAMLIAQYKRIRDGKTERIARAGEESITRAERFYPDTFPPFLSHSSLVIGNQPCPLQLFIPLQELLAVAHAVVPLQELTPMQ